MSKLFVANEGSRETASQPDLVSQILDQLEPIISRQRRAVARHGCLRAISSTHLHVLYLLEGEGPLTMSRLAELLDASLPNVTGIVDRMAEKGLVERGGDATDRRVVTVRVTAAGHETIGELDQLRRQTLARTLSALTAEQQQRALQTFKDMRAAMESVDDVHLHSHTHSTTPTNN